MLEILDSGIRPIIGITTVRQLKRELRDCDDNFVTVVIGDREYTIDHIKNMKTHANCDDSCIHKALVCDPLSGNIIR